MIDNPGRRPFFFSFPVLLAVFILLTIGQHCKRFEPQAFLVLTTGEVESVSGNLYKMTGNIINVGDEDVIQHGFCWSESANPSVDDESNELGEKATNGIFTSTISGFTPLTTYFVRAYATAGSRIEYGTQKSFTTAAASQPQVSTTALSGITENSAAGGGEVTDEGGSQVTSRGVCWSKSENPSLSDKHTTDGSGPGVFSSSMEGLDCNTIYYVRAYATNSIGTAYGSQIDFATGECPPGLPTVTTLNISGNTDISAEGGGVVNDEGGSSISARGVCWSTTRDPDIETGSFSTDGTGMGSFNSSLTGLDCNTKYYVRAYATNSVGTAYGLEIEFTTGECPAGLPEVSTSAISSFTDISAQGGGVVTDEGSSSVLSRGVCWSTTRDPDIETGSFSTDGTGTGAFNSNITGLDCNTIYYVKAYATNSSGTSYGLQVEFTTSECPAGIPEVTTSAISSFTDISAQGGGVVTDEGSSSVSSRGVCWSTTQNPDIETGSFSTDGTGKGAFSSNLTGLDCNTIYYVKAYATNSSGTSYGLQVEFTTSECPFIEPTVTTSPITNETYNSADGGGEVTDEGGGNVTARGVCWSTSHNPELPTESKTTNGNGIGLFNSTITGLDPETTYYIRAYATNSAGTSYGDEVMFKTLELTVTDIDGNEYKTVYIGGQVWTVENLRVTHYPDGSEILLVESESEWDKFGADSKAYCWYNNSYANGEEYGALYTWAAAVNGVTGSNEIPSGIQGVCPNGWHLPSDAEWNQLEEFIGMSKESVDSTGARGHLGGELKETGLDHWLSPNLNATDTHGFSARATGLRKHDGTFSRQGLTGNFWAATEDLDNRQWVHGTDYDDDYIYRATYGPGYGFPARCIQD